MDENNKASQGDELSALTHQAGALDASLDAELNPQAQAQAAQAAEAQQAGADNTQNMLELLDVAGSMLGVILPNTGRVLSAKAPEMAAAAAPVLVKYGINLGESFGRWGAEIGMAAVWIPAGLAIAGAISQDRAEAQAKAEEARKAAKEGVSGSEAANEGQAQAAA